MYDLLDTIWDEGPQSFKKEQLVQQQDLFAQRAALFYTPTNQIPTEFVGRGEIDICIPIPVPNPVQMIESRIYRSPRFWVDLIQSATQKLRWKPFSRAKLTIIRYDTYQLSLADIGIGLKALVDALKVETSGRRDRRQLYYFGAIADDNPTVIVELTHNQEVVKNPSEARSRIIVEGA